MKKITKILTYMFVVLMQFDGIGANSLELYGIDNSYNEEVHACVNGRINVFGEDVSKIQTAFLSSSPSCHSKEIILLKLQEDKYVATYTPNISKVNSFDSQTMFFCTLPQSYEINSIVKLDSIINVAWAPMIGVCFVVLLFFSAMFSGLNLAIMSFSIQDLQLIVEYDIVAENRKRATDVLMVRRHTNFVLCSIITANVLCNTLVTLIIDYFAELRNLKESIIVEMTSTVFLLIFTEILPALFCTKKALYIASKLHYLVIFFMVLTSPLTYPISKLLDYMIGKGGEETMKVDDVTRLQGDSRDFNEVMALVRNTLKLGKKKAKDVMTPIENVFMISDKQVITKKILNAIIAKGHSRLPVFAGDDVNTIRGVLNVKDLVLMIADDQSAAKLKAGTLLSVLCKSTTHRFVMSSMPVPQLMNELEKGTPLAIVVEFSNQGNTQKPSNNRAPYKVVGIVTLEDNIEEVVGEILDEKDILETSQQVPSKLFAHNESPAGNGSVP